MQNLIDNAVKFMGEQPEPCIEIGVREDDDEAVCYIRDNGIGIDPSYHEKIFGLFDKLDADSKSTGVGLALVKRIIEVHGGRIWVESEGLGKGSTFCFTIPAPQDKRGGWRSMRSEKSKDEPMRILLVEDNQDHADLIMRSLENHRGANRIHHISDGEAALDYLFRQNEYTDPMRNPRPEVILLDLRLPKIDGLEVLKKIKTSEQLCQIPVVVLTTSEAERDVARAYEYHANSYLVKPVDFEEFTHLMSELCYYWLGWNRRALL